MILDALTADESPVSYEPGSGILTIRAKSAPVMGRADIVMEGTLNGTKTDIITTPEMVDTIKELLSKADPRLVIREAFYRKAGQRHRILSCDISIAEALILGRQSGKLGISDEIIDIVVQKLAQDMEKKPLSSEISFVSSLDKVLTREARG
ncbi:MAG: hypothetical protein AB7G80_08810 [Dongiaceae bacterium]